MTPEEIKELLLQSGVFKYTLKELGASFTGKEAGDIANIISTRFAEERQRILDIADDKQREFEERVERDFQEAWKQKVTDGH